MIYHAHPSEPDVVVGENGHCYPSNYTPDLGNWALVEAWQILDAIKPDVIPIDVRSFLAGRIAGALECVLLSHHA